MANVVSKRQAQYNRLCAFCARGREPVRREVFANSFMWLHDSVQACGANDLRKRHRDEDAIAAQKEQPNEDKG